jgi:hypothetical protein
MTFLDTFQNSTIPPFLTFSFKLYSASMDKTSLEENYSKNTVVELREELRKRGLKVSGRKSELIERIVSAVLQELDSRDDSESEDTKPITKPKRTLNKTSNLNKQYGDEEDSEPVVEENKENRGNILKGSTPKKSSISRLDKSKETIEKLEASSPKSPSQKKKTKKHPKASISSPEYEIIVQDFDSEAEESPEKIEAAIEEENDDNIISSNNNVKEGMFIRFYCMSITT